MTSPAPFVLLVFTARPVSLILLDGLVGEAALHAREPGGMQNAVAWQELGQALADLQNMGPDNALLVSAACGALVQGIRPLGKYFSVLEPSEPELLSLPRPALKEVAARFLAGTDPELAAKIRRTPNAVSIARQVLAELARRAEAPSPTLHAQIDSAVKALVAGADSATVTVTVEVPEELQAGAAPAKLRRADQLKAQIAGVRELSSLDALQAYREALLAHGPIPKVLARELAEQEGALTNALCPQDEEEPIDMKAFLTAMLSNKAMNTRPGVRAAILGHLQELGIEPPAEQRPLGDLSVEELQAAYTAEVGRTTSSSDRGYLVWKIREARKGRVTVGEVKRGGGTPRAASVEVQVLAVRVEADLVAEMDSAWRAQGAASRNAWIRAAIVAALATARRWGPEMSAAQDVTGFFGDVIASYSRAQAHEYGLLVDVSEMAKEAGIRFPCSMTRAAWTEAVEWTREEPHQDESGRLWDVLWMLVNAMRASRRGGQVCRFQVLRIPNTGRGQRARTLHLKAFCGPGDDPSPVLTIMLPEED